VLVVNKWDLVVSQIPTERWVDYLREAFPTLAYVPIAFITGQTGKNIKTLLNHAQMLYKQSRARVSTGELNRLVRRALEIHPPPLHKNRRPKVYYATQVAIQPPTIVLMCNMPRAITPDYQRYLLGLLRDELRFGEVPIRMFLHRRGADDQRDDVKF
jgi:GTP-binding protein